MVDYAQGTVTQFNKGLITEASEMTFPEGASVDELNCDLFLDGTRRRRLGIELEAGAQLSPRTVTDLTIVSMGQWENVAEQADTNWLAVQVGGTLRFYDLGGDGALSANAVEDTGGIYEVDLTTFSSPSGLGASNSAIQLTSIRGLLVVASENINTFYIEYDPDTNTFTETEIMFRVRDFNWQGDITTYESNLATGSTPDVRKYDTKNAGWADGPADIGSAALTTFLGSKTAYPALTHSWFAGKNSSGTFSVTEWDKVFYGSALIPNGHYIVDLYSRDRNTVSGIAGLDTTEDARFSAVAAYAGRVWYAGMSGSTDGNSSKIFFSQDLIEGTNRIGELLQRNDPTSELSDLLDTDGGYVNIPEAHDIRKLHTFGADLYIFAANGVWRISGVDDVFRATEYSVQKLSEDGIVSEGSFVSASGKPYYWSNKGIHTLGVVEGGAVGVQNLSVSTVQSHWDSIGATERSKVRGIYDGLRRRVVWLFPTQDETNENKRNRLLLFDETLGAFIPWTVSDQSADTDYIVDATFSSGLASGQVTYNVVDSSGDQVIDSSGNEVVVTRQGSTLATSGVTFLVVDGTTSSYTFAAATDTEFLDWGDADYSSYAESPHNFIGDASQRKETPYLTTFMRTTETGWEVDGDGYATTRPSSCRVSAYWDFKTAPSFKGQEMYRQKYPVVVDTGDLSSYDYPATVVVSKLKLRGRGRAMRLRFDSVTGKDFHLIGYDLLGRRPGKF